MGEVGFIPGTVTKRGEEIYRSKFQGEFEANFLGQFAVIDVRRRRRIGGELPQKPMRTPADNPPTDLFT